MNYNIFINLTSSNHTHFYFSLFSYSTILAFHIHIDLQLICLYASCYNNNHMDNEIQQLICPICMLIFRRPLTISCGHTFCYACLNNSTRQNRNCPICRQHISNTPNKIRTDQVVQKFIQHFRKTIKKSQLTGKIQNTHIECKPERLLLIDIVTDDLLLPNNKISATFELQSNVLIDRMERFAVRQEIPFNKYAVVSRLVHIQQIRKNLYRGVIEGKAFCNIDSEEVESEISLQSDEQQFFYRTCKCKEISETSDTNPAEYNSFFMSFNRIEEGDIKKFVYNRINPTVFTTKIDSIAILYSILGIIDMDNLLKYKIAISFDEQYRVQQIKSYMEKIQLKIRNNPEAFIRTTAAASNNEKKFMLFVFVVICLYLFSRSRGGLDL